MNEMKGLRREVCQVQEKIPDEVAKQVALMREHVTFELAHLRELLLVGVAAALRELRDGAHGGGLGGLATLEN